MSEEISGGQGPVETQVTVTGGEPSSVPESFMKQAMANDPEYAAMLKPKEPVPAEKEKQNKIPEVDQSVEKDGKNPGEAKDEPTEVPVDEKNAAEKPEEVAFEDNVIEGVKGSDFAALKPEAQEAIANFYSKAKESESKLSEANSKLERLLKDPVVSARAEMLDSGKNSFDVRGITQQEKESIIQRLQAKIGLTEEEAKSAFDELEGGIKSAASAMAEDMANNLILQKHKQSEAMQTVRKGMDLLLKLGELNPTLAIKEKDLNKFFTKEGFNESHPEIGAFKKGLGPFMQMCGKLGIGYDRLIELEGEIGLDGVYAMVAAKLKLPVALNSGERDKKLVIDAKRKALAPFLKNSATKTLSPESGTIKDQGAAEKVVKFDGYDIGRLATDAAFYERCLNEKPFDRKHKEKIDALVERGQAYLKEKQIKR